MKPLYQRNSFIPDPQTHKGRWQVYDIKEGGMGWVYIVYDHKINDVVAIKTYKDKYLQKELVKEQFKKESLAWINFGKHENITQAIYVQEIDERIYLFLEYVVGGDLTNYIGTKMIDTKQTIIFALQFCYGMVYATAHGLICHRDIKPTNCLITNNKTLKITDFGLAKIFIVDSEIIIEESIKKNIYTDLTKTKTGEIGGTPFYMSPEQFEDMKYIDIRSDIYSFGIMLYEMISGKLPFYGTTLYELKESHKKKAIPDLSTCLNTEERSLIDIIYKCLAKHPDDRYTNFTELVNEFQKIYQLLYKENPPLPKKGEELTISDLINKGVSLGHLKRYEEEIVYFDKTLTINPKSLEALCNKGSVLGDLNRYQEALACFDKVLKINPEYSIAWYGKGVVWGRLNRPEKAIEYYTKALEIDPKYANAWCNAGVEFENLYKDQIAIECYQKALEINPKYIRAWYNKGVVLTKLNHYQEAIECFDEALKIDSEYIDALCNKGVVLFQLNYYQEAIDYFDKVLMFNPKFAHAWCNKGCALEKLNYNQKAIECYDKVLSIDPTFVQAWFNKGIALSKLNHYQEAIKCFNKTLEINPKYLKAWSFKGFSLFKLDYLNEALECFKKAKELGDPNAIQGIALCLQKLQEKDNP